MPGLETEDTGAPTLAEALGQAFDEQAAKEAEEFGTEEKETEASETTEEYMSSKAETAEGESGDLETEEVSESEETVADESEETADTLPPILPPVSWNAQDKNIFKDLPREVQEVIKRRESERDSFVTKTREEFSQAGNELQRFKQVLTPVQQRLRLQGMTEEQYISQLIAADDLLQSNPAQGIQWLSQQYGLDPSQLNDVGAAPQADSATTARIAQLEAMIAQQQQSQQQSQELQTQTAMAQAQKDFENFALEADEKGNLQHPYVADIGQEMIPFAASIRQQNPTLSNKEILAQAYERAVWANPETREALMQSKEQSSQKRQRDEVAKKAARAKKAGSSVNGSPSNSAAPVENGSQSLRASLLAAFDEISV